MPYWTPPVNPYAIAFIPPSVLPTVKVETKGASAYEQERNGQRAETLQVVPINRGELERTEKGDYVQQHITVVTATQSYTEEVVVTDIGAGSSSLVPVSAPQTQTESFDVEQVSWAPTTTPVEVFTPSQSGGSLDNWNYDWSWYQPETAPSFDVQQSESPFYQPETAAPPVSYAPLPVEQAPVDEPQYVQPPADPYQEYLDYLTQLEQMENEGAYGWGGPAV